MSTPVTQTKILLPRRRPEIFTRQRLLELLYELTEYKLIIVAAPAGYGKTSLLVDFAHQVDLPVCWYALDPFDRDPSRFFSHLIAAISNKFPSFGKASLASLESDDPAELDVNRLVSTIANEVYEHIREHFLLVLDDYHLVNDSKEVEAFVNRFVQEVGENCHLVLSSRTLLTLPDMPLLVSRAQVGGLSFEELAFQGSEIKDLVFQNYHMVMPDSAAEELAHETEGWITGLLLSAQTMWQGMADRLRVARVSGVGLYDYLAQQVLEQQPPEVRDFLLRTSLFDEFDIELFRAVFGSEAGLPGMFDFLLHSNLFVLPVGEDGRWVRYHHLFRDFLQSRLEQEHPQERDRILHRLAVVYADREDWDKSYDTYRRLGEVEAIADLIEQAGSSLIVNGRLSTLAEWIDALPVPLLSARPKLISIRGTVEMNRGHAEQALSLFNQAEPALRLSGGVSDLALTLIRRAIAYRFSGDYQRSLQDASEALALIEGQHRSQHLQADALRAIGMSFYELGQLKEALDNLERALSIYRVLDDAHNIAMVLMELGMAYMSAGSYRQALFHYRQALEYWQGVNNMVSQATLLNNLGVLHHFLGEYEQAASLFEAALAHARQNEIRRMEAYILCSIGDLYAGLDAGEAALEAYHQSREIAQQIDNRFLLLYLNLAEAIQARLRGEVIQARSYLEQAERLARVSSSDYELGLWLQEAGQLRLAEEKPGEAANLLQEAVERFERGGQWVEAARACLSWAAAFRRIGDEAEAEDRLERAFQIAAHLESQHVLVAAARGARDLLESLHGDSPVGEQVSRLVKQVNHFEKNIASLRRNLRPHTSAVPFAPPKLTIHALGRAQVELDGKPVTAPEWQNQKRVREFFFCLLAHPDGLTKEAVGLIFWPDSSPSQLKLQFKNTIYRLRYSLGQEVVSFDEDRYWFNRNQDYEYDVEVLLDKLAQGREAATRDGKISAYRAVVNLYKGSYLPEISGSWVWPERERLWQAYVESRLNLARLYLEVGAHDAALAQCHDLLAEDVCHEEAHRLAMRVYAEMGNRAEITRQYERCRKALWEEVNAPPSRQTEHLFQDLMR